MAASEALEFEKAIEYRELLNSVKKVAQKQKITDSSGEDRDVHGSCMPGGRCGCTGLFYPWRKTDRKRSFLSDELAKRRDKGGDSGQFYQTVLCGNPFSSGRTDAAGRNRRAGTS